MGNLSYIKLILSGRKKYVVWAITTACNCRCDMCGQWKQKHEFAKDYEKLIDFMKENKVIMLSLTGGEPTLHPELTKIIKYAKLKGFYVHLLTNGTTMTPKLAKDLKESGLDLVSVSIDHYKPGIQDKLRGYKNCHKKAVNAVRILKDEGLNVITSTVITSESSKDIEKVIDFINNDLNCAFSLCTPHTSPDNKFFAEHSDAISIKKEDLINCVKKIIKLKKEGSFITNSIEFMEEYINSLKGINNFYCQGGDFVYYLDTEGGFHQCINKPKIFDLKTGWKIDKTKCYNCEIQCFKESSILNQLNIFKSAIMVYKLYKQLN